MGISRTQSLDILKNLRVVTSNQQAIYDKLLLIEKRQTLFGRLSLLFITTKIKIKHYFEKKKNEKVVTKKLVASELNNDAGVEEL